VLEPVGPAVLTNCPMDLLSKRIPERSFFQLGGVFPTTMATDGVHFGFIPRAAELMKSP
jgi:hypothetical protein